MKKINKLLKVMSEYEPEVKGLVSWTPELTFFADSEDVFFQGCPTQSEINDFNLEVFEQSLKEGGLDGVWLFCARVSKMRPQGLKYRLIQPGNWKLFDDCGPEREVNEHNPNRQPRDEQELMEELSKA